MTSPLKDIAADDADRAFDEGAAFVTDVVLPHFRPRINTVADSIGSAGSLFVAILWLLHDDTLEPIVDVHELLDGMIVDGLADIARARARIRSGRGVPS